MSILGHRWEKKVKRNFKNILKRQKAKQLMQKNSKREINVRSLVKKRKERRKEKRKEKIIRWKRLRKKSREVGLRHFETERELGMGMEWNGMELTEGSVSVYKLLLGLPLTICTKHTNKPNIDTWANSTKSGQTNYFGNFERNN